MKKWFFLICFLTGTTLFARQDPVSATRSSLSLNGTWEFTPKGQAKTTMPVPGFWANEWDDYGTGETGDYKLFPGVTDGEYVRTFDIPATMQGQRIWLAFESVNYIADIYVNSRFVSTHKGGYVPFKLDISDYVSVPSTGNSLRVVLRHDNSDFLSDAKLPKWPIGLNGHQYDLGITQDVNLLALPDVFVEDAWIITSVRNKTITVQITVRNAGTSARSIRIENTVQERDGTPLLTLPDRSLSVPAGGEATISVEKTWNTPRYWWPKTPHLYFLRTLITEDNRSLDEKFTRFGFREVWAEGNKFFLNGVRFTLFGETIVWWAQNPMWQYYQFTPEQWRIDVRKMKEANITIVRMHQEQHPRWFAEIADEEGMMLIAEAATYASDYIHNRLQEYIDNSIALMEPWIKRDRNHPSIVIWSAENEMRLRPPAKFTFSQLKSLGDAIERWDNTRPIVYDGDKDLNGLANTVNYHYIFGWPESWPDDNNIYRLDSKLHPAKITMTGEFGAQGRSDNVDEESRAWRNALLIRGYRHAQFFSIHPYHLEWMWTDKPTIFQYLGGWQPDEEIKTFMRNSYSPVAVFDKEYDRLGIPSQRRIPAFDEGSTMTRTLIVYNNDYEDEVVELRWQMEYAEKFIDRGSKTLTIPLGEYSEIDLDFQLPRVQFDDGVTIWLMAYKNDSLHFREKRRYWIYDRGADPDVTARALFDSRPASGEAPLQVEFDAAAASGNKPLNYFWDYDVDAGWSTDATGVNATATYSSEGQYRAALIVEDTGGERDTSFAIITVTAPRNSVLVSDLEAEAMSIKTTGEQVGNAWLLDSNGHVAENISFPESADYRFIITAAGSPAFGEWPRMALQINGVTIAEHVVDTPYFRDYSIEAEVAAGVHKVAVAFLNDGYDSSTGDDRNLRVDRLTVLRLLPVPVELSAFTAENTGDGILLSWQTATESSNYGFYIERRQEGKEFEEIGFVAGNGTTSRVHNYTFLDRTMPEGVLWYRLRQTDSDGAFYYTSAIQISNTLPQDFNVSSPWPNPVPLSGDTEIRIFLPSANHLHARVLDVLGREITTLADENREAGAHLLRWRPRQAAAGIYFLLIEAAGQKQIRKIVRLPR